MKREHRLYETLLHHCKNTQRLLSAAAGLSANVSTEDMENIESTVNMENEENNGVNEFGEDIGKE
jgi:hypothetical protein